MNREKFLEAEPRLARLFINSRKKDRLANAYLLFGNSNAPLKETAIFLAKSLGCERDLLACDSCPSCRRFDENVRPDFYFIDGAENTIKKEEVKSLESAFALSSFEKNHRLVYVINQIQNITTEAANSLLKFLEEPREGQIAFLTTSNIEQVLPTIRSRSIEMRLDPLSTSDFIEKLSGKSVSSDKKTPISQPEAYILSRYFSDVDEATEMLESDDDFRDGFAAAERFLYQLVADERKAGYVLLKSTRELGNSQCYNWMYRSLEEVLSSSLISPDEDSPFLDVTKELRRHQSAVSDLLDIIREALTLRQVNLNQQLLIARMVKIIDEEY